MSDAELASFYLGITQVPCIISSPLRRDRNPSFGLYSNDGVRIYWVDFATKERGGMYDLLSQIWHCNYKEVLIRIKQDINRFHQGAKVKNYVPCAVRDMATSRSSTELQCKVREWRQYDIDYWQSYGVPLEWLKYAEVYPISHKIVVSGKERYVYGADKLAYAFVEHKDDKVTLKIYQPLNKAGYKWANKHDRSVISLWSKIPESGNKVVICSSLKDALCLWANTGIPAVALQGEGYGMSDTAISELKRRFANVYILFDNDEAGLMDGRKLAEQTGFTNVTLPKFSGGKDVSDYYKTFGYYQFRDVMLSLFDEEKDDDLPF